MPTGKQASVTKCTILNFHTTHSNRRDENQSRYSVVDILTDNLRSVSVYSRCNNSLRVGQSRVRTPVGARDFSFTPLQIYPATHTASCTMHSGAPSRVQSGRGQSCDHPPPSGHLRHEMGQSSHLLAVLSLMDSLYRNLTTPTGY